MNLKLTGKRTPAGVDIVCSTEGIRFRVEFDCHEFKPLSRECARWSIDGRSIELAVDSVHPSMGPAPHFPAATAPAGEGTDDGPPRLGLEESGWTVKESQWQESPSGALHWLFELHPPAGSTEAGRLVCTTRIGSFTVSLIGEMRSGDTELADWLVHSIQTVRAVEDSAEPRAASPLEPRVAELKGTTVGGCVILQETLSGQASRALVNSELANSHDAQLVKAVLVPPSSLLELAIVLCAVRPAKQGMMTQVFDGENSHVISIVGYDAASQEVHYMEPWGKGSFLNSSHNAAGVRARPHASRARIWVISRAEMARVLYALVLRENVLFDLLDTLDPLPAHMLGDLYSVGPGMLGKLLGDVLKQDLFVFFHLRETGRERSDDGTASVLYRPTAPFFAGHVRLSMRITPEEQIQQTSLSLSRTFVHDRQNFRFALDLARSFVRQAGVESSDRSLRRFVWELTHLRALDVCNPHSLAKAPSITLPHVLTRLRLAYAGCLKGHSLSLGAAGFSVVNNLDPEMQQAVTLQFIPSQADVTGTAT